MKAATYITTSWDDGHPLDGRVAELLARYELRGTFYVPRFAENGTMTAAQLRELSSAFEIGAHTLHHLVLTGATEQQARSEIVDSRSWVEECTGQPCPMFCPPKGKYSSRHLEMIRQAGYAGVRGVELLSIAFPRRRAGLLVLPTTVQAHPHGLSAYARNVLRRGTFRNLWQYVVQGCPTGWPALARSLLGQALRHGGVFHLWGHSWELQETGQWQRLEEVLRYLSRFTGQAAALTNGQLCRAAAEALSAAGTVGVELQDRGSCR